MNEDHESPVSASFHVGKQLGFVLFFVCLFVVCLFVCFFPFRRYGLWILVSDWERLSGPLNRTTFILWHYTTGAHPQNKSRIRDSPFTVYSMQSVPKQPTTTITFHSSNIKACPQEPDHLTWGYSRNWWHTPWRRQWNTNNFIDIFHWKSSLP